MKVPEAGRPTVEAGNLYHDLTTIHCLLDMLAGNEIVDVWPEAIEPVDDIRIHYTSGRNGYQQVKEDSPGATWSATALVREGVVGPFIEQWRRDPESSLVFVTAGNARGLRNVSARAASARANHQPDAVAVAEWDTRLRGRLGDFVATLERLLTVPHLTLFEVLAQVRVHDNQGTLDQRRNLALERLLAHVADAPRALLALEALARESALVRRRLTVGDVRTCLVNAQVGFVWAGSGTAVDNERYASALGVESDRLDVAQLSPLQTRAWSSGRLVDLDPAAFGRRTVLKGRHGAGKSRTTTLVARSWLASGRPGLHVRLGRWVRDLGSLLRGELSRAAEGPATVSAIDLLGRTQDSFIVLDGLDEVRSDMREVAVLEIEEFARTYPGVQLLVSTRPDVTRNLEGWDTMELADLSDPQVASVLGNGLWASGSPQALRVLAHTPLMLGLLKAETSAGRSPRSEGALLNAYVGELIRRQSTRGARIDESTGWRIAEDMAWGWLDTGRIGLSHSELRGLASFVAKTLRDSAVFDADAPKVESWFLECGLATAIEGVVLPAHRALLDHLAGRAAARHDVGDLMGNPALREAIARYIGGLKELTAHACATLDAAGTDLGLLARCSHLVDPEINWSSSPEEFATQYVAGLRRLTFGPLVGLGVAPPALRIEIDRDLTWVSETADPALASDVVTVTERAARAYVATADGSNSFPVSAIRFGAHRGQEIKTRVPQLAAYGRARDELLRRLKEHLLPDEGPDIVYERLSRYATRAWEVLTVSGLTIRGIPKLPWLPKEVVQHLTARQLLDEIRKWASDRVRSPVDRPSLGRMLVLWVPYPRPLHGVTFDAEPASDNPYDPGQQRDATALHGAPLLLLVDLAERFGIADLPLHPLGLLPTSATDVVLDLPSRPYDMDRAEAELFVSRHHLGELQSVRHIVRASFGGLATRIPSYTTLPRRITVALSPKHQDQPGGWYLEGTIENNVEADEVRIVETIPGGWKDAVEDPSIASAFSSSIISYRGVADATYSDLEKDLNSLLGGSAELGAHDL